MMHFVIIQKIGNASEGLFPSLMLTLHQTADDLPTVAHVPDHIQKLIGQGGQTCVGLLALAALARQQRLY